MEDSSSKKDNLYIIKVYNKDGKSLIKLGYSSDIKNRMNTYYYHNPMVEVVGTYYRDDAIVFEKTFHSRNKSKIMNEWYLESELDNMINSIGDPNYKIDYTPPKKIKKTFKDTVIDISKIDDSKLESSKIYISAVKLYPFLPNAIKILGFDGMKNLKYVRKKIKDTMEEENMNNVKYELYDFIESKFELNKFISRKYVKSVFKTIFTKLSITSTVKSTCIKEYYDVKEINKRIDGIPTKGYILIKNIIIK